MTHDYWKVEIRRLLGVALLGVILGYLSGYWLLSLLVTSCAYIGWVLYKLRQLQLWLASGQPANAMPDSDGAWEQITYLMHRSKQKSKARKKKQREALERLNGVMAALPDATLLLDADHVIQWSNRAAAQLLAIQAPSDWGQRLDNLLRSSEITALLEAGSEAELTLKSPRDDQTTLLAYLLPVQKNLFLLTVRDISQRIHLQETRKAFFANASHELRTPLTVLSGYLELFESEPDLPAQLHIPLQQAREQAERMQHIIRDMLALSKLENDELRKQREELIDAPELLQDIINNFSDTVALGSHTFSQDIDQNLQISGCEVDFISLVTNLIENAIKHTPDQSHISIQWRRSAKGQACLVVEDNGPGIPPQHLGHLTERFYRVDKGRARDKGGTGLGLAIVKHILLNHSGHLDISSEPGCTRFTACFPPERIV